MPIYGSQWHPEKAAWEWDTRLRLSHVEHVRNMRAPFSIGSSADPLMGNDNC
jgi:hypothetical protein